MKVKDKIRWLNLNNNQASVPIDLDLNGKDIIAVNTFLLLKHQSGNNKNNVKAKKGKDENNIVIAEKSKEIMNFN